MHGEWNTIEARLADRIGLDPVAVGPSVIPRAVKARMSELGLVELNCYASLLGSSEVELQALIEEVVVPESWFFRDEEPFHHFRSYVRSRWVANPALPPLRVLSIPCAGGEEPYSVAIALMEIGLGAARYQITAVDVSLRRLEIARLGVYSSNAFRGSDLSFRDRHFREHARGLEIDPLLRARVQFLQGSILDPGLLAGQPAFDVVFCRNLLIYLDEPSRALALSTLDRLLAAEGILILGHADRLNSTTFEPVLTSTGDRRAFCHRKMTSRTPSAPLATPPFAAATWQSPQLPSPRLPGRLTWQSSPCPRGLAADQVPENSGTGHAPEPPVKSRLLEETSASGSGSLLDQASELANLGRHAEALEQCERSLRQQGPSAPAYYLMGVIHQSKGNRTKGEECFQKAVYLDPGHDEALLALALSAERRGDAAAAAGFRRRASRAITRKEVK